MSSYIPRYPSTRKNEGVRELIPLIGPIPILIPLKLFYVTKFKFQNAISSEWINKFHPFFFSFEILVTRPFRNTHKISHNAKRKIWRQPRDVILPPNNVKIGKNKIMKLCKMTSSILPRKFRVIALKLNKLFEI